MTLPDALLSHRANGIYGEMWAAALVATAFTVDTPEASVAQSLRHIPATSRLAAEIRAVTADHAAGTDWEHAIDRITARHPGMSWVHTINNAGALTAAILWGAGDFATTVGLAVQAGLDTDSIGASAGAWARLHRIRPPPPGTRSPARGHLPKRRIRRRGHPDQQTGRPYPRGREKRRLISQFAERICQPHLLPG